MSTTGASSGTGKSLVSSAERTGFADAVLAGKLEPDFAAVAYHFEGWLDKDVIDAIFEVSSGPTEAVSALAGMFPPESAPADGRSSSNGGGEGADQPSTTATQAAADAVLLASIRHARILEDIQAQRGPPSSPTTAAPSTAAAEEYKAKSPGSKESLSSPTAAAPSTAAAEEDEAESPCAEAEEAPSSPTAAAPSTAAEEEDGAAAPSTAAAEEDEAESSGAEEEEAPSSPTAAAPSTAAEEEDGAAAPSTAAAEEDEAESPGAEEAGPEAEVAPASGGVDDSIPSSSNTELEKVAAFIASNAGEQEAVPVASRTPAKPLEPPFLVPRGISVPSTRKVQLAIAKTAEKAVELPGFEAFMKMQHGKDSLFRFLAVEHALHSYYLVAKKHVQETVIKGGKARGAFAAEPRKDPSAANDKTEDPDVAEIMRMLGGVGP